MKEKPNSSLEMKETTVGKVIETSSANIQKENSILKNAKITEQQYKVLDRASTLWSVIDIDADNWKLGAGTFDLFRNTESIDNAATHESSKTVANQEFSNFFADNYELGLREIINQKSGNIPKTYTASDFVDIETFEQVHTSAENTGRNKKSGKSPQPPSISPDSAPSAEVPSKLNGIFPSPVDSDEGSSRSLVSPDLQLSINIASSIIYEAEQILLYKDFYYPAKSIRRPPSVRSNKPSVSVGFPKVFVPFLGETSVDHTPLFTPCAIIENPVPMDFSQPLPADFLAATPTVRKRGFRIDNHFFSFAKKGTLREKDGCLYNEGTPKLGDIVDVPEAVEFIEKLRHDKCVAEAEAEEEMKKEIAANLAKKDDACVKRLVEMLQRILKNTEKLVESSEESSSSQEENGIDESTDQEPSIKMNGVPARRKSQ